MEKMIILFNMWRIFPVYLMIYFNKNKSRILEEVEYWGECSKLNILNDFILLSVLLMKKKEYRNLLYMRLRSSTRFFYLIFRLLFPLMETLHICCDDIGKCLYIQHGFATQIAAKAIGEYCWINQQVTVGYGFAENPPSIGNGVRISAGAKVIGDIMLGDNSIIGANAAVVKNVEENDIVGGVSAKKIGINTEHKLFIKSRLMKE